MRQRRAFLRVQSAPRRLHGVTGAAPRLPPTTTAARMVAELERLLSRHALQHGVAGDKALKLEAQLQHRLPFRPEPYTLVLHLPPLPATHQLTPEGSGSGFGQCSAELLPVASTLELRDAPHRLQQWFGARAFLLLTPDSYSGRVLDEEVRAW